MIDVCWRQSNIMSLDVINKTIIRLENNRGQSLENDHDILNECKDFYKNLYTEADTITNTEQIEKKFFIEDHTRLAYDDNEYCEGILTMEECTKPIKEMPNGKSPGTDGFAVDWYKYFWSDISKVVLDSLHYAYIKGELSVDQRRRIITFIPKKGKSRMLL